MKNKKKELLRSDVRLTCLFLQRGGPAARDAALWALSSHGIPAGARVGETSLTEGSDEVVEWFVGQLLSLLGHEEHEEMWFAVEAMVEASERFVPLV